MKSLNRLVVDRVVLVFLEVLAALAWLLAVGVAFLLGVGAHGAVQSAAELVGASDAALEIGRLTVAFATGLVVVSGGALAVAGYRRVLESRFEDVGSLSLTVAPIVGIVVPVAYVVATTEGLALPWWAFVLVAVAAHALAFRTITISSMQENRIESSMLVGAVATLPAIVAATTHAGDVPVVGEGPFEQLLLAVVARAGVPLEPAALVAAPLLVAAAYTLLLAGPVAGAISSAGTDDDRPQASEPTNERGEPSTDGSGDVETRRATDRSPTERPRPRRRKPVVPSSPSDRGSRSRRTGDDSSATESEDESPASDTGDEPADDSSGDDEQEETTDESEPESPAAVSPPEQPEEADTTEKFASDTRIFAGGFGSHEGDADPAETCPDCDEEIPSDGAYTFCPLCGSEL